MASHHSTDTTLAEQDLLVLAAQSGNRRAFAALFKIHHRQLLRFAARFCNDHDLARDAVQDAWLGMTKALPGLRDPRAFRSWLYRRVRWRMLDALRTHQRQQHALQDDHEAAVAASGIDSTRALQEQADSSELLREALAQLSLIDRQAIELFYLQQLQINEIAVVLEIPAGTVKSRLNRARKLLRELLGAH